MPAPAGCAPPNGPRSMAILVMPLGVGRDPAQRVLVERLERERPRGGPGDVLERLRPIASPTCPSSPAVSPAPKTMKTAMPFAVAVRNTDPRSDSAATIATAARELETGHDDTVRPPAADDARDDHRRGVDDGDVHGAGRSGSARTARGAASAGRAAGRRAAAAGRARRLRAPRRASGRRPGRRRGRGWRTSPARRSSRRRASASRRRRPRLRRRSPRSPGTHDSAPSA